MSAVMAGRQMESEPMIVHVVPAEGPPFDRALDGDSFVIGRSSKAELTVADRSMSRLHARLFLKDGGWHVEDLGSRNGTLLAGRPVEQPTRVGHGAVMQVGSTTVTLREASRPLAPAAAARPTPSRDSHTIFRSAAELLQEPEAIRTDSATPIGESLRRYAERLRLLTEVNRALDRIMSLEELLDLILDRAFAHLRPEEAAIYLRNDRGGYDRAAARSSTSGDPKILFSTSLMEEVVEGRQAALVLDAQTDERFHEAMSLLDAGVRSLVAAPNVVQPTISDDRTWVAYRQAGDGATDVWGVAWTGGTPKLLLSERDLNAGLPPAIRDRRILDQQIAYNIRQFAQDVIAGCEGPELLRAFWQAIESVTILDPTVGSGAFLFAALNVLFW